MSLFLLLCLPVLIGLGGLLLDRGKVTAKEFLIQEGAVVIVIVFGYLLALSGRSDDVEHWGGKIARKWTESGNCCHSYPCNCHEECSGSGRSRTCSERCDTCYEHSHDQEFYATTTNGEHVYSESCVRPGRSAPARWAAIVVGEPTTVDHSFTNYVKANPETILRRTGAAEGWKGAVPLYPMVYDAYRIDQFLPVQVSVPRLARWNEAVAGLNAELGAKKQVNVIVIVAAFGDPAYAEGVRQKWLGGKKNDLIVVIGAPDFPALAWASVISWSDREEMKIAIRDRIVGLGTFDGDKVVGVIRDEVAAGFVRKRWADLDYLKATIEPSAQVQWFLGIFGVLLSIGLTILFHKVDVFEEEGKRHPWASRNFPR